MRACQQACLLQLECVRFLVEQRGARVNQRDVGRGWTPLHRCANMAHHTHAPFLAVFEYLLQRGADAAVLTEPSSRPDQAQHTRPLASSNMQRPVGALLCGSPFPSLLYALPCMQSCTLMSLGFAMLAGDGTAESMLGNTWSNAKCRRDGASAGKGRDSHGGGG